jgi:heterodisulfide reductase subunit A-like polyferredoxin
MNRSNTPDRIFDMVVLSTGFRVQESTVELARRLGIELNTHLFAKTEAFSPVSTSRPGIYVCGVFESPKDIPGNHGPGQRGRVHGRRGSAHGSFRSPGRR